MEFGILRPLEAWHEGQPVGLAGPRVRLVLAALLVDANQVVTIERLADVLWAGDPPAKVRRQVQNCVSQGTGLDPGHRLAVLQQAILCHSP